MYCMYWLHLVAPVYKLKQIFLPLYVFVTFTICFHGFYYYMRRTSKLKEPFPITNKKMFKSVQPTNLDAA